MRAFAIIGGTGLEALPAAFEAERVETPTALGPGHALRVTRDGHTAYFIPRHGADHDVAPHLVDYRRNALTLLQLGVTHVLATNAVGSLRAELRPSSIVVLDDFIDFTRARPVSLWDGVRSAPAPVLHTDFSVPYCPALREGVLHAAAQQGLPVEPRGVYLCVDGPRFESPAEVRAFRQWGADVVGMTGLPEAVFAREAGLCYAAVAIVTNFAAGVTRERVAHGDVVERMSALAPYIREVLWSVACGDVDACECRPAAGHRAG